MALRRTRVLARLAAALTAVCALAAHGVADAQTYEVIHTFPALHPVRPYAPLIQATDGFFYGTATRGGINDAGAVFRMDTAGTVTFVHEFAGGATEGVYPYGGLVQAPDGNLYGMTSEGGTTGAGTIYRITLAGVFTTLRSLTADTDGANPQGALIVAGDGNLYGTTSTGGSQGRGTVFRFTTGGAFTVLRSFSGAAGDGGQSDAPLIQAADGNLYGTTKLGGSANLGTVFKLSLDGNTFALLHSFVGNPDGQYPEAALIQGSDGDFYGTTSFGGTSGIGAAFRMTAAGTLTVLHSFQGGADGREPWAALIEVSNGTFWGTTRYQGAGDQGNMGAAFYGGRIFKMTSAGVMTPVHDFVVTDGAIPYGLPVLATDGLYYGTTSRGGDAPANGAGTTYKITAAGVFTKLYSFDASAEGARPHAPFVRATDGSLYSTTALGGHAGWGVIYRITPAGVVTVLHEFDAVTDSQFPQSGLIQGTDGDFYGGIQPILYKVTAGGTFTRLHINNVNGSEGDGINTLVQASDGLLYGTANLYGASNKGIAFKATTTGTYTVLHAFAGGATDGDTPSPFTHLVEGADGNLYGTTQFGGVSNGGTVFKLSPTGTFTLLHSFDNATEGSNPQAPLVLAKDGNFYGTTFTGGPGTGGTVFRMTPAGVVTVIHEFGGALPNGAYPVSGLVQAPNSIFFGTTSAGGASNRGTVYSLTPEGLFTVLHSFAGGADGQAPVATPTLAPNGNLYGTTFYGGAAGQGMGVVFHMTVTASNSFTDDPLVAGTTPIKALHVTELRTRINALRAAHGLAPYSFTDADLTVGSSPIKAQHIVDLRNALAAVYVSAGLTAPTYTDPSLAPGTPVRAVHLSELRAAVIAIE